MLLSLGVSSQAASMGGHAPPNLSQWLRHRFSQVRPWRPTAAEMDASSPLPITPRPPKGAGSGPVRARGSVVGDLPGGASKPKPAAKARPTLPGTQLPPPPPHPPSAAASMPPIPLSHPKAQKRPDLTYRDASQLADRDALQLAAPKVGRPESEPPAAAHRTRRAILIAGPGAPAAAADARPAAASVHSAAASAAGRIVLRARRQLNRSRSPPPTIRLLDASRTFEVRVRTGKPTERVMR